MEFETPSQFHALKRSINVVASLTIILLRILLLSIHLTDNLWWISQNKASQTLSSLQNIYLKVATLWSESQWRERTLCVYECKCEYLPSMAGQQLLQFYRIYRISFHSDETLAATNIIAFVFNMRGMSFISSVAPHRDCVSITLINTSTHTAKTRETKKILYCHICYII